MRDAARRLAPLAAAIGATVAIFAWVQQLWNAHAGVPFDYSGDSLPHALIVKQVVEHGWYWSDARLAAPFGEHFQDWPVPEQLDLVLARFLSLFSHSWPVVVNAMYLITYPLVTASAWWVLRKIGTSPWVAAMLAVLYSLLPYHFGRGEEHLFLSGYYMVPIGLWFALCVIGGESLFPARASGWRFTRFATWQSLRTVVFAIVLAGTGAYYGIFTVLLIGVAVLARLFVRRRLREVVGAVALVVIILGTVLVCSSPTILYQAAHGANSLSGHRSPSESEQYALKLALLLLPTKLHRIASFAELNQRYVSTFPIASESWTMALGFIGSAGLIYLLLLPLINLLRPTQARIDPLRGHLAVLATSSFLIGTVGGVSTFIALLVTDQLHAWARFSIFLGFAAFAAIGLLLDGQFRRLRPQVRRPVVPLVLAALLLFGTLDQTTTEAATRMKMVAPTFLADQAYFKAIESRMDPESMIFELPIAKFPEAPPIKNMGGYDLLKPYMHTQHLRWSFGGVKGRFESQWQERIRTNSTQDLLFDLVAANYDGLYIDRLAYDDSAARLESEVTAIAGVKPFVAPTAKSFFDLRPYAAKLRRSQGTQLDERRTQLYFPVEVQEETGKLYDEESDGVKTWHWASADDVQLVLDNSTTVPIPTKVSFSLVNNRSEAAAFSVQWPDRVSQDLHVGGDPVSLDHVLVLPPGRTAIRISSNSNGILEGNGIRKLFYVVQNVDLQPSS